jgi:DNA mismatch endonuclease (patch repair protein)
MRNTAQRDTDIEVSLRSALHREGYRYRLHPGLPEITKARPDFAFMEARVAVFVDGCFWHHCSRHGTLPKRNRSWWRRKLLQNVERDRRHDAELRAAKWMVVRVWEHEEISSAAKRVERALTLSASRRR